MNDSRKSGPKWHLAKNAEEGTIVDLELALLRLITAFNRFNENAVRSISGHSLSAAEANLLHVVRMNNTAKTAAVLAVLLNRDDFSNIQYALKKLRDTKLIRVNSRSNSKQYSYEISAKGKALTDKFVEIRSDKVIRPIKSIHEWEHRFEDAADLFRMLIGIYEEAARETLVYWVKDENNSNAQTRPKK